MNFNDIKALVEQDFFSVNQCIHQQLCADEPLVEHIGRYILDSGGKRLRPLLVLLSAKALAQSNSSISHASSHPTPTANIHLLAAVIEFLHTATLLHDDVVDTSNKRRGRASANAEWGNAPAVLVGDFLYARAFQMMVDIGSLEIMTILAKATATIAEGEVMQLANIKNPNMDESTYLRVIYAKTAMLFEASTHSASVLATAPTNEVQALQRYGKALGMAFQLIDDYLDYRGDASKFGKNIGDDLAEGKLTLPLIVALQQASDTEKKYLKHSIRQGGRDHIEPVIDIINRHGALAYTKDQAHAFAEEAKRALEPLTESSAKQALFALTNLTIERNH